MRDRPDGAQIPPARLSLGPIDIDLLSEAEVVDHVRDAWSRGAGGSIVTANVDIVGQVRAYPELAALVRRASLVVADGMPVVWAGRIAGGRVPERVTGASMVRTLSAGAAADGRSVYLLGGEDGVPESAARVLQAELPGLTIAGSCSPPFGFDASPEGVRDVVEKVRAAQPDLVLVGMGFPRQERLIEHLRQAWPEAWYLGCGAGIPMAAGVFRRAPDYLQRAGLEWLHRLALEPRRLAGRYLGRNVRDALSLVALAAKGRLTAAATTVAEPPYVCFSAQDWWYHNQAHSDFQLMRRIAEKRRVLVVNSIGMRMPAPGRSTQVGRRILRKLGSVAKLVRRPVPGLPQFHVMSPLPLPFYSSPFLRRVNAAVVRVQVRAVCGALRMRQPVFVATLPTAWDVIRPMVRTSVVFNRSDRHSAFPEADQAAIAGMEKDLLSSADRVVYVSRALMTEEAQMTGDRAYFLDHGVDLDHFHRRPPEEIPDDLRSINGPVLGFFGALDDFVVDFELLEQLAASIPDAALVLIGATTHTMDRFDTYPNVHVLGFRSYDRIPAYGSGFDVALMPWVDTPWIHSSNPIKLKEYLALGLPVVTTEFAEVERYRDVVRVADDRAGFVEQVRRTLSDGGAGTPATRRQAVAGSSWTGRAQELISLAESPIGHP
jgi:exopolysaccharide biosynthesis WecB/TagA/CpsF family protein